jgi:hypothetical protein
VAEAWTLAAALANQPEFEQMLADKNARRAVDERTAAIGLSRGARPNAAQLLRI